MIVQKIRLFKFGTNSVVLRSEGVFSGMKLKISGATPSWVTTSLAPDTTIEILYINTAIMSVGNYSLNLTLSGSPPLVDARLDIELMEFSSFLDYYNSCSNGGKNICWITREGGRANYVFDQRKDYGVIAGENKVYENSNYELKYFSRGKVYNTIVVYKSALKEFEIDYITSLRNSIQAWEYDDSTDTYTPILIESDDFSTYNTKQNFNELSLTYRYAKANLIQNG